GRRRGSRPLLSRGQGFPPVARAERRALRGPRGSDLARPASPPGQVSRRSRRCGAGGLLRVRRHCHRPRHAAAPDVPSDVFTRGLRLAVDLPALETATPSPPTPCAGGVTLITAASRPVAELGPIAPPNMTQSRSPAGTPSTGGCCEIRVPSP